MSKRRGAKTAAEVQAELDRDPEYLAAKEEFEQQRRQRVEANREAAAPVVREIRASGFQVDTISDLFNQRFDYREVVPVLLHWLPRVDNQNVKESIVRALTVKWARPAAAPLMITEYRRLPAETEPSGLRWAIGNALEVVADDSVFDDLREIVLDRSNGSDRQMVVLALGNMRKRRGEAVEALLQVLGEDDVAGHAVMALGRLKAVDARSSIEPFLHHSTKWVRDETKRALTKIDK